MNTDTTTQFLASMNAFALIMAIIALTFAIIFYASRVSKKKSSSK